MRKARKLYKIQYGRFRLVNKKTGRLASSSTWLVDLAACAVSLGHSTGIASLLPLAHAQRLLVNNTLKPFKRQKIIKARKIAPTSHGDLRTLAEAAIPAIAVFYGEKIVATKAITAVNRKGFVHWLVRELQSPNSQLNRYLLSLPDLAGLAETQRAHRWWLDRLKMQSKLHATL